MLTLVVLHPEYYRPIEHHAHVPRSALSSPASKVLLFCFKNVDSPFLNMIIRKPVSEGLMEHSFHNVIQWN